MILVVENCTGDIAAKVNNFILDILGMDSEPASVPEIIPEKPKEEPIPDTTKATPITRETGKAFEEPVPEPVAREYAVPGGSATFGHAFDTGDTRAVIWAMMQAQHMEPAMKYTIIRMSKRYILWDCSRRNPETASTAHIKRFFADYEPLIKKGIKHILDSAAYATLNDFFELTDEYMHQDAYRAVLEDLIARSKN